MRQRSIVAFICGLILIPLFSLGANFVNAQSDIEKLQTQISEKNTRLADIEKEIAQYKSALNKVGAKKNTLQKAIDQLELERKKIGADIRLTESKITSTDLEINKLTLEINKLKRDIAQNQESIQAILRSMNFADNESTVELLLRNENISEFWNEFESLQTVKDSMQARVVELSELKDKLASKKNSNTEQRNKLVSLKDQYKDQNDILIDNKKEKGKLLSVTKNEESNYQAMLKEKAAARDRLQAEVRDIESQIQFILDPNTIPTPGTAVFRWPLDPPIYITQNFGYTRFALSGAYGGSKHNGMDMGAPVGTKIYAPLSGTVRNIGNTDLIPGCYSWGKWALIDHQNGLSSMFAHMSQIAVQPGQKVNTGDVIGYVGSTGYSTGPHLHYTLYVKDAVQVLQFKQFKTVTGCGAALSPFAGIDAYLNPRDYLPPL